MGGALAQRTQVGGTLPLQPPVTRGAEIPQLPAGTSWGDLGGATTGLTLTNHPGGTPAVPLPSVGWALGRHAG